MTKDRRVIKYKSNFQKNNLGSPQGSNLEPLIFLCYLVNVNSCLNFQTESKLSLDAEDENVKISSKTKTEVEKHGSSELLTLCDF